MNFFKSLSKQITVLGSDDSFLVFLKRVETLASKVLSLAMVLVLAISVIDLCRVLITELFIEPYGFFGSTLIEIFGLFLNVLIALEILENITAYLKKHVIQVELVIATSLTAVARKIIIFDFKTTPANYLIGLGLAIFTLSISYWLVRRSNKRYQD